MIKRIIKFFLKPILSRLDAQKKEIVLQGKKIKNLEALVQSLIDNPDNLWLYQNKMERMDASIEGELYDQSRKEFHLDRYRFALNYTKGQLVADIACGTGYGTRMIVENGAMSCIGIDIALDAITYAQRNHNIEGTQFICASGDATPVEDSSVDVVVSFETIEHVPNDELLLQEFYRILKPGGRLICSTPNQWPLSIAPYHTKEYDIKEFQRVLSSYFKIEKMYNQNSGSAWEYNRKQPVGITPTSELNEELAECYIAVCTKR